jgi:hypothetical protein
MPRDERDFPHDVFISYSHADQKWVRDWLVPRLKAAGLRVCIDYESFDIGAASVNNMERAAEQSRKTLLVMTPNWVESEYAGLEALLVQTGDPIGRARRLVPLMLKKCQPRSGISILTYADFTDPAQWESEFGRALDALRGRTNFQVTSTRRGSLRLPASPSSCRNSTCRPSRAGPRSWSALKSFF